MNGTTSEFQRQLQQSVAAAREAGTRLGKPQPLAFPTLPPETASPARVNPGGLKDKLTVFGKRVHAGVSGRVNEAIDAWPTVRDALMHPLDTATSVVHGGMNSLIGPGASPTAYYRAPYRAPK